jgi:polyribonucleotide nucleotidyltransferase
VNSYKFTATLGNEIVTLEAGKLAQQAGGAVTVRYGDTLLLVTATMSHSVREGIGFFPLTVDFEERLAASQVLSFAARDGRPNQPRSLCG